MSKTRSTNAFPRGALYGAAVLIAVSIGAAAIGGEDGGELLPTSPAVVSRDLHFIDGEGGVILVKDAASGADVARFERGNAGFVRGAMRGLARERKRRDLTAVEPFRLSRWADGRLAIADPATGRFIDLGAFGPDNAGVFARMLGPTGERS